jgi:hypothetical protein
MTLSYQSISSDKRKKVKAIVSFDHSTCSYGRPAIVLPDGSALGLMSWAALGYQVEKATDGELRALRRLGMIA